MFSRPRSPSTDGRRSRKIHRYLRADLPHPILRTLAGSPTGISPFLISFAPPRRETHMAKATTNKKKAKRKAKKATRTSKSSPTEWVTNYLKKHGDSSWPVVEEAAKKAAVKVKPINLRWGRAAAGLPPKTKRKAKKGRRKAATARGGPGRRRRKSTPSSFRQEAADKLRAVASKAILQGDDKAAGKLLEMIKQLG